MTLGVFAAPPVSSSLLSPSLSLSLSLFSPSFSLSLSSHSRSLLLLFCLSLSASLPSDYCSPVYSRLKISVTDRDQGARLFNGIHDSGTDPSIFLWLYRRRSESAITLTTSHVIVPPPILVLLMYARVHETSALVANMTFFCWCYWGTKATGSWLWAPVLRSRSPGPEHW